MKTLRPKGTPAIGGGLCSRWNTWDETLVIMPSIRGDMFRYAQLQTEANALRRKLDQRSIGGLVLDLQELDYLGAEVIGAVVALRAKWRTSAGGPSFAAPLRNSPKR